MKLFSQRLAILGAALLSGTGVLAAESRASNLHDQIKELREQDALHDAAEGRTFLQRLPWLNDTFHVAKSYLERGPVKGYLQDRSKETVKTRFSHAWAHRAYDHKGNSVDPASSSMGNSGATVKDLFIASRLLTNDQATVVRSVSDPVPLGSNRQHFLHLLAGQEVRFVSSSSEQEVAVSYDRLMLNDSVLLQVKVPFVRREHTMALAPDSEISRTNRAALVESSAQNSPLIRSSMGGAMRPVEGPAFYDKYSTMEDFLQQTLDGVGVAYHKKQEIVGLGAIEVDLSMQQPVKFIDTCELGVRVKFGTGRSASGLSLWQPATGQSATSISVRAHNAWHRGELVNPFFNAEVGYSLPHQAARRVPLLLSYDGAAHDGERMMEAYPRSVPFSELVVMGNVPFGKTPETQVASFASSAQNVLVRNGFSLALELGNSFEQCFGKPLSITVAYAFATQQKESISQSNTQHEYATDIATAATGFSKHRLLSHASYRLNPLCSLSGGASYQFAGSNAEASVQLSGGVSLHF